MISGSPSMPEAEWNGINVSAGKLSENWNREASEPAISQEI